MLIQVNTDGNIEGGEKFLRYVEAELSRLLSRFADHLTRLDVHLSDENGAKTGLADKRCLLEARPEGRRPVIVSHDAATVENAWTGATKKLERLLEADQGRIDDHRAGASINPNKETA